MGCSLALFGVVGWGYTSYVLNCIFVYSASAITTDSGVGEETVKGQFPTGCRTQPNRLYSPSLLSFNLYTRPRMPAKRPTRLGNISGATGDHPQAMHRMAYDGNVNVIIGDWLSKMNIAWNAIAKAQDDQVAFAQGFLDQLGALISL